MVAGCAVIQTLRKNWWLLALCGVLDAAIAAIYFVMNGPLSSHSWNGAVTLVGELAMAAGMCSVAAGIWRSANGRCWLLVLNGLALCAFGVIAYGLVRFPISFLTVAALIIVMAVSLAVLELTIARGLRREWFSRVAGVVAVGFAAAFLALGARWIGIAPGSHADLVWMGAYFAFSAICMLVLAMRLPASRDAIGS